MIPNNSNRKRIEPPPWNEIREALMTIGAGEKFKLPIRRSDYEKMHDEFKKYTGEDAEDAVKFIDWLFQLETKGKIEFSQESH